MMNLNFWKANKSNKGAAALFNYNEGQDAAYLSMAAQGDGERSFDMANKSTVKLDLNDMGEMLTVIRGSQNGVGTIKDGKHQGLFHKNARGRSIISFSTSENRPGFVLSINQTVDNDSTNRMVGVTLGEAEQLRVFLESAIRGILAFDRRNRNDNAQGGQTRQTQTKVEETDDEPVEVPF